MGEGPLIFKQQSSTMNLWLEPSPGLRTLGYPLAQRPFILLLLTVTDLKKRIWNPKHSFGGTLDVEGTPTRPMPALVMMLAPLGRQEQVSRPGRRSRWCKEHFTKQENGRLFWWPSGSSLRSVQDLQSDKCRNARRRCALLVASGVRDSFGSGFPVGQVTKRCWSAGGTIIPEFTRSLPLPALSE